MLPSVAAAVIGGTSIMGGRGGFAGTIVGALILTVLTSLLTALGAAAGDPRGRLRRDHRDRRGGLHPGQRRGLIAMADGGQPIGASARRTRHLGLDLGATNLKWTVVEHDPDGTWRALDRGQVPTLSRAARTPSSPSSARSGRMAMDAGRASRPRASGSRACTTRCAA